MRTVPLHGEKAAGRVALVDDEDYDLVMQYRWNILETHFPGRISHGPYATTRTGGGSTVYMHKLITGWARTDHEDHNGLNNQRSNLRPATNGQNNANSRPQLGRSSRFKGVTWNKAGRKWRAHVVMDGRQRYLGQFASEELAARAYDEAAIDAWGEFACTNFNHSDSAEAA